MIKLTLASGRPIWVSPLHIVSVRPDERGSRVEGSRVHMTTAEPPFFVTEAPEEIEAAWANAMQIKYVWMKSA